jgi:hypothetical protein
VRFSHIVLIYATLGIVMWGGGAIGWADSGVAGLLVEDPATGAINDETGAQLEQAGGPIQEAAATVGGTGLLAAWNLLVKVVSFLFWPIVTLQGVGAPARVWVTLGGVPTIAFYATVITLIRSSA